MILYTGWEFDTETNLYYYRARYYDSTSGRFKSEDPVGFVGGINFYAYVGNNPIGAIDPLGLDWLSTAGNFSAGAGDVLTIGGTYLARKYIFHSDQFVNKCSLAYFGGAVTGAAIGAAFGGTAAAVADGKNGALFGRGGAFFNQGPVRFGWSWEGSAEAGKDVIRLGIGAARGTNWWSHIPFYYP